MKISSVIIILVIHSCTVQAMDLVSSLEFNKKPLLIKTIQDIPQISFENIRSCFSTLSDKNRFDLRTEKNKNGRCLDDSLMFNVALLPDELRLKIIGLMFVCDNQSATMFYKTPLLYAFKRYQDTRLTVLNSAKKEKSEKWIAMFFRLSTAQQNGVICFTDQSSITQLMYGGSIVKQDEYEAIQLYDNEIQDELLHGEDVALLNKEEELSFHIFSCDALVWAMPAVVGMGAGIFVGGVVSVPLMVANKLSYEFLSLALGIAMIAGGSIGGIIGCVKKGREIRNTAQKIEI